MWRVNKTLNLGLEEGKANVGGKEEPKDDDVRGCVEPEAEAEACSVSGGGIKLLPSPSHSPSQFVQISKDYNIESHPLYCQAVEDCLSNKLQIYQSQVVPGTNSVCVFYY